MTGKGRGPIKDPTSGPAGHHLAEQAKSPAGQYPAGNHSVEPTTPPSDLIGVVLCGGESKRMGRDKIVATGRDPLGAVHGRKT